MPRVVHFEISVDEPERAKKFYEKVFEWKIEKAGPMDYWLISTEGKGEQGVNGALRIRSSMEELKNENTINTISVPSVDEFIKKVEGNGGKVLTPKMAVMSVGYLAYCRDTEGNAFGILEANKEAK